MFILTPVSALSCTYQVDPYSVAWQHAARVRRHRQEQLKKQLILDAIRAQEYDDSAFYGYGYPVCPGLDHCGATVIQQARLEQVAREHEARYQEFQRLAALRAQREEQELHARRRADTERFLSILLDRRPEAQSEFLAQPTASTSKVTIPEDEPSFKHRLEERLMTERESDVRDVLQSLLSSVSGYNPSEAPVESTPIVSTAADPSVSEQEIPAPIPSEDKGKGKELPQSDSNEEPFPAEVSSSLSQISYIASSLETLLSNFQFPAELDFSPQRSPSPSHSALDTDSEFALTYTPTNTPLRAQEHALSLLLSELDNVPSFGARVVKDARRAVVARVEQALEELEKGVEERRGRARARVVSVGSVQDTQSALINAEPVEETSHPMDVDTDASSLVPESADLAPILDVPSDISESVDVSIMDAPAEGPVKVSGETLSSAPMELYDTTEYDSHEISVGVPVSIPVPIGLPSVSAMEPNNASSTSSVSSPPYPTTPSVSEILAAQVSVSQDESSRESEELLVNAVSLVSEDAVGEDMVVIENAENAHSATHMDLESSSYELHPEANGDTSISGSVSAPIPDYMPVLPAEAVNTIDPSAGSSAYGEQNVSDSRSAIESPAYSSPRSESEVDTFLLSASRPASPYSIPRNSEEEDEVVVNYEEETEHENEDDWSHIEA